VSFDIWSVGDPAFLYAIIDTVAMMHGEGFLVNLLKIGAAAGFLLYVFSLALSSEGALRGSSAAFSGLSSIVSGGLMVVILAAFFFGTTTTVRIHNPYNMDIYVVDNVPFGYAVTGSFISRISHQITDKLEQTYTFPGIFEDGFLSPLERIIKTRELRFDHFDHQLDKTLKNYARECTYVGISLGLKELNDLKNSSNLLNAVRFDSNIYTTFVELPTTNGVFTCSDAHDHIGAYVAGPFSPVFTDHLRKIFDSPNPLTALQDSFDILDLWSVSAQNFMLNVPVAKATAFGLREGGLDLGSFGAHLAFQEGREQRNVRYGMNYEFFLNTMRPFQAFFEAFFYALIPFAALMIGFAPMTNLLKNTVMLTVWVLSWSPMLAIVHFFTLHIAKKLSTGWDDPNFSPYDSVLGMQYLFAEANDWLAVASLVGGMTPILSMVLIFGASAVTQQVGSPTGGASVGDEAKLSPQSSKVDAAHATAPRYYRTPETTHGPAIGREMPGGMQMTPKVSMGSVFQQAAQSSQASLQSSSETFSSSLGSVLSSSATARSSFASRTSARTSTGSSVTETGRVVQDWSSQIGKQMGWNKDQQREFSGALSGKLSASGGAGVKGGISSTLQNKFGITDTSKIDETINNLESASKSKSLQADLNTAIAKDVISEKVLTGEDGVSSEDRMALEKNANKLLTDQQTFQRSSSLAANKGLSQEMEVPRLAAMIKESGDAQMGLTSLVAKHGLTDDAGRIKNVLYDRISPDVARQASQLHVLEKNAHANNKMGKSISKDLTNYFATYGSSVGLIGSNVKPGSHLESEGLATKGEELVQRTSSTMDAARKVEGPDVTNAALLEKKGKIQDQALAGISQNPKQFYEDGKSRTEEGWNDIESRFNHSQSSLLLNQMSSWHNSRTSAQKMTEGAYALASQYLDRGTELVNLKFGEQATPEAKEALKVFGNDIKSAAVEEESRLKSGGSIIDEQHQEYKTTLSARWSRFADNFRLGSKEDRQRQWANHQALVRQHTGQGLEVANVNAIVDNNIHERAEAHAKSLGLNDHQARLYALAKTGKIGENTVGGEAGELKSKMPGPVYQTIVRAGMSDANSQYLHQVQMYNEFSAPKDQVKVDPPEVGGTTSADKSSR
jgi:hypothetical protein